MGLWDELRTYYREHYESIATWRLRPGDRVTLGSKVNRICRFCGRATPAVSFRNEAHALPECIGNKSLFTYYECDSCNAAFGTGCENDYGNWSLPARTTARIRGKNGIPTIRQGPNNAWRVGEHPAGLSLNIPETEGFWEEDDVNKILKLHLRRGPYRPTMVIQALVKAALSVMPEEEMPNFQQALDWIRPGNTRTRLVAATPFVHTIISGPVSNDLILVDVLIRKHDKLVVPYCFFALAYGHDTLQVAIPCPERDQQHNGKPMTIRRLPSIRDEGGPAPGHVASHSLLFTSTDYVRGDIVSVEFHYEQRVPTVAPTYESDASGAGVDDDKQL